jgi:hypothetical protein
MGGLASLAAQAGIAIDANLVAAVAITLSGNAALDIVGILEGGETVTLSADAALLQAGTFEFLESIILTGDASLDLVGVIGIQVPSKARFIVQDVTTAFVVRKPTTKFDVEDN